MSNRYSLTNYPETYETFGVATELKQVAMVRQGRKVREQVRATIHGHFDHESMWWDGRHYFVLLEPYREEDPQPVPELAFIRIPLCLAPYHQSRKKRPGFKPPMGAWLFGLPETKEILEEIAADLDMALKWRVCEI